MSARGVVFNHPARDRVLAMRPRVLRLMRSAEQRWLVELVCIAEKILSGYAWMWSRRGKRQPREEVVSPAGYYLDGSMRCPFEDIRGHQGDACAWHTYSGCSS